ncbi:hypothetical protein [Photobacterium leiognathi]|uniref:hypothetical protein n=1 Tax=Photobacterium leiognathi TaxID=553611 RepID=UPI0027382F78|nr:hypothetical protein [Photobacterium leiognathi]
MDTTAITLTTIDTPLRDEQKQLLLAHANGATNAEIAKCLGTDLRTVNYLNLELQRTLKARSLPHAIACGFMQGLLSIGKACRTFDIEGVSKSLCCLLVVLISFQHVDDSMRLRTRLSRRVESSIETSRLKEI